MELIAEKIGDVMVVTIYAEHLDASNDQALKDNMAPIVKANPRVLIDLSHIGFADSSGLGALLVCFRKSQEAGGELKIGGISAGTLSIFQMSRLDRIIDISETREHGLRSFDVHPEP